MVDAIIQGFEFLGHQLESYSVSKELFEVLFVIMIGRSKGKLKHSLTIGCSSSQDASKIERTAEGHSPISLPFIHYSSIIQGTSSLVLKHPGLSYILFYLF